MRLRPYLFCAAIVLLTFGSGCKRLRKKVEASVAPLDTTAPTLVMKDTSLELKEFPSARGSFRISKDLAYEATFFNLPEGTRLTVDGVPAGNGSSFTWTQDLREAIGALPPAQALDFKFKVDPKRKGTLTFKNGASVDFAMPPQSTSFSLGEALKGVSDRPLVFGKLDATKPAVHTVVLTALTTEVLGPGQKMSDVDWVAIQGAETERPGKICTGFRQTGDKASSPKALQLKLMDRSIVVVDRITSKEIAKREFKAKNICPTIAFGSEAKSFPQPNEIKDWLRDLRGK